MSARYGFSGKTSILVKIALVITVCFPVLLGCSGKSQTLKELRVDPAALAEVRNIGRVVAQDTTYPVYDGTAEVTHVLIIDTGVSGYAAAAEEISKRLRSLGWVVTDSGGISTRLKSAKWKGAILKVGSVEDLESYGATFDSNIEDSISLNPEKYDTYVVVDLYPDVS